MNRSFLLLGVFVGAATLSWSMTAQAQTMPNRSAPPPAGPVRPFTVQQPQEFTLTNGLRVSFLERKRAPLVDVIAVVDAGASVDPAGKPGIASFTSSMLTEGAGDLDAIAFSDAQNALGAAIEANADAESASVSLHVSSLRFPEAMKIFALALTRPRFDDKDWQRVQQQTFGYYLYQAEEPQELLGLAGARANWGAEHRLGTSLTGTPAVLAQTGPADLRAFHLAHYRPDTTKLIVVGDIDRARLEKLLGEALGSWSASGPTPVSAPLGPPRALTERRVVAVNVPGAPQAGIRVQNPAPADLLPWTADVQVMNTLLGGSFTSRLNTNLREEHGYSYGAGSQLLLRKAGNIFVVRTSVATPVTAPAAREILGELERIQTLPAEDEVARARSLASLSLPSMFDSGASTARVWADVAARGYDPKRLQRFMADALQVDANALQDAARRVVKPNACTFVVVGDLDAVGKDLDGMGPRTTLQVEELLPGLAEAKRALGAAPGE